MTAEKIILNASFPIPEKTGTVRVKFAPLYSGGECDIDGFDHPTIADLETLEIDTDPPALIDHNPDWVAGKLENIAVEKDENGELSVTCDAVIGGSQYSRAVLDYFGQGPVNLKPSIGIRRIRDYNVEYIGPGETARVNGRTFRGPVNIVRHGHLAEGSFVTMAGDPEAKAFLARLSKQGETRMTFEEFLEGKGITPEAFDALSDEEKEALTAEFNGAGGEAGAGLGDGDGGDGGGDGGEGGGGETADAVKEEVETVVEEAVETGDITPEEGVEIVEEVCGEIEQSLEAGEAGEDEKEVQARIRSLAKKKVSARVFRAKLKKSKAHTVSEARRTGAIKTLCAGFGFKGNKIAARAIEEGWSLERTEKAMNATIARDAKLGGLKRNIPGGGKNAGGRPSREDVMKAAFAMTCKLRPEFVQKHFGFSEAVMNAAMERGNRNVTLRRLIVDSVNSFQANYANAGANLFEVIPAMRRFCKQRKERELSDRSFKAAMGFSTISATDILHAITEAYLADLEDAAETKYQLITKEVSLSDFNAVDTYLPTLQGRLKKISETGQIEHVSYTTEKISAKTEPLGVTFAIPEMVLINDRLEVFVDLLQQFRDLPGECLEHDVAEYLWKMVDGDIPAADGQAFFSAARGNYFTGAGTALSEAGLSAAVKALDNLKNENGRPISTQGAFIVTGSAMEATALRLYASENLNVVDTIGEKNIYQGKYKPYKWEYLNAEYARAKKDDGTTDSFFQTYADTAWFMFRDPTRRPIMTVNKLSGYETPQIRQYDADPSVWGTVYQLIFPYSISAAWTNGAIVMRGQ